MSLQLLLRASLPTDIEESKPVSPTLVVGLGGTGKEILLRFRRMLVERYGSLNALPFLQFIHLDTDSTVTSREQYNLKAEDDPLFQKVRFNPGERVDLTIEGGTGKYVEHINTYPHIKRWFQTEGKIAGLGNLGEGAGQIRIASRLGFYHDSNFAEISTQLSRARRALQDASNPEQAAAQGFELDPSHINVFVATSLAGGTGSGTFIDMGFLLQQYFPDSDRVGILLLPNFFQDYAGGNRARANGYAALTELNYYSFGHPFLGNWDGVNADWLPPPPYTNTYLMDSTNEAGLVIGSAGKEYDAYQMVAEFLFQDFSVSSFSGLKRATRINLVNFNLNVYTHNFLNQELLGDRGDGARNVVGDTFPTRFGSFGLASIAFPTDRVQSACACRLARKILSFWEQTLLEDSLDRLFTDFLSHPDITCVQGRYERRDGGGVIERRDVEDALLWYDRGSGKNFQNLIWERAQEVRSEIESARPGEKAAVLALHREQFEQLLSREDSEKSDEWGQWVRIVEDNRRVYQQALEEGLRKHIEEIANKPELGVAYALSLLREFKGVLRNESFEYVKYFEDAVGEWVDEIQRHGHHLDQLQHDLGRHEKKILFRDADLERDLEQLVAVDDKEEDLGAIYNYLNARVMKQVAKRGRQICEALDRFLGRDDPSGKGLLAEYYQLLVGFQRLKDRLESRERYFRRAEKSELTVSLYRGESDVEAWYETWLGEREAQVESMKRVGNQLLSKVFEVDSVTAALETIKGTPPEEVEDRMVAHCKRFFEEQEEQPEALRLLLDGKRFSRSEREDKVRLAYRLGKVWLQRAARGLDHIQLSAVAADQRPCMIGVDDSDKVRFHEFKQLIERIRSGGDSPPSFKGIGERNRGTIVFYNELAGVPAFYPSSVLAPQGLRQAYERFAEKDELHIDKNRFQFGDLIPKSTGEARRYADSLKAFVLARLLGLLKVQEVQVRGVEQPTFRYSFRKSETISVETVQLGDEPHAVDLLYRDRRTEHQTDRQYLLRQVEKAIQALSAQHKLPIYALLIEFYMKVVYPPREDHLKDRNLTLVQYSPQYAVLDSARAHLDRKLPSEHERGQMLNALEQLRRKSLGEPLEYEEYVVALEPYTKASGKVEMLSESEVGIERTNYFDALALDLGRIDESYREKTPRRSPTPPKKAGAQGAQNKPRRPCPRCGEAVDVRARYCLHCKDNVADYLTCEHCESQVPDDLETCWNCGMAMPIVEEAVECPRCFSYAGPLSSFPCPECGHDPAAVEDEGMKPTSKKESEEEFQESVDGERVECPTCFEEVAVATHCEVCGGLLG